MVGSALLIGPDLGRRLYGLLLVTLGVAMAAIAWSHAGPSGRLNALLEDGSALLASPLFFSVVALSCRLGGGALHQLAAVRRFAPHFLVFMIWLVYAVSGLLGAHGGPRLPILAIVLYQASYTAVATRYAFFTEPAAGATVAELRMARAATALFIALHIAQGIRFFVDRAPWDDVVPLTAAVGLFALTFLAARESQIFRAHESTSQAGPKYESSSLSEEQARVGLEKLFAAIDDGRAFLRPELTLDVLASEVGMARTYLSQLVNERVGTTFPELLAERRVAWARGLLEDPRLAHLTVEAIGERSGFQSRSAFYAAFKKQTGLTPAAYRKDRDQS